MTLLTALQSALGIRRDERKQVWFAFAVFFWGGTARALGVGAAYSAFITEFGGETVPYIYILTGIMVIAIMSLYLRFGARISLRRMLGLNLGFSALMFALLAAWLAIQPSPLVIFALPVWFEAFCVLLPLALWALAGRLFNVRQGKRLFGIIASGIPLGFLFGGFLTAPIAIPFGAVGLLVAAALCLLVTLLLTLTAHRLFPERFAAEAITAESPAQSRASGSVWRSRYVLLIYGILGGWTMAFFFLDTIFAERLGASFSTEVEIAAVLGIYSMARGALMLFSGMLLAGPILSRYGVRAGLLVLPLALAASTLAFLAPGLIWGLLPFLFWPAFVAKLVNYGFDTVNRSSLSILYQPLPDNQRLRVQTSAEGLLQPLVMVVTGVLLLVLLQIFGFTVVQLAMGLLIILAAWTAIGVLAGREYPNMLMLALMRRRLGDGDDVQADEASRSVLVQALQSERSDVVIYALDRLQTMQNGAPVSSLLGLLDHPQAVVRQTAAARLAQCADAAVVDDTVVDDTLVDNQIVDALNQHFVDETLPEVRGELLRTALAIDPERSFAAAVEALTDASPIVRQAAATGLLRSGGIGGVLAAGPQVLAWLTADAAIDRITGARTLGEVGVGAYYQPLVPLFADHDVAVRRAAVEAAGALGHARLWPYVVTLLTAPTLSQAAVTAMANGGDAALPAVGAAWHDATPKPTLLRLAHVCARIRTPAAAAFLVEKMDSHDVEVRSHVLYALQRCGYQAGAEETPAVHTAVVQEGREAAWVSAALVDLADDAALDLLRAALEIELAAASERVLHLLAFVSDAQAVRRVQDILNAPLASADQRAYAQEILDIVTPQSLKPIVLTLVDDLPPENRLQRLRSFAPSDAAGAATRLHQIITAREGRFNGWTVACALAMAPAYLAGERAALETAAASSDPLVHETAGWVLSRIDPTNHPFQEETMLSTLERVLILKHAAIFGSIPDNVLAAVAATVEEVELEAGDQLFAKGDLGKEMYIIVSGCVRIHDGAQTLTVLGAYDVFGEMALLDAEPRSASATAAEETSLLRLRQDVFFELMADHAAIARGVILVLSQRLRARSEEVAQLRTA